MTCLVYSLGESFVYIRKGMKKMKIILVDSGGRICYNKLQI